MRADGKYYRHIMESLKEDLEIMVTAVSSMKRAKDFIEESRLQSEQLSSSVKIKATLNNCSAVYLASKLGLTWEYGMQDIAEDSPIELETLDIQTGLYPFMLIAGGYNPNPDLDTIFKLMRMKPELAKIGESRRQEKRRKIARINEAAEPTPLILNSNSGRQKDYKYHHI